MNAWNKIPLFRLIIPLIFGIIFSSYTKLGIQVLALYLLLTLLAIFFVSYQKRYFTAYKRRWVFGLLVYVFMFLVGVLIAVLHQPINAKNHFINIQSTVSVICLNESVISKENSNKAVADVVFVKHQGSWVSSSGKAIVYFEKDSLSTQLIYGDYLLINGKWQVIKPPQNPAQFNYKNYLSNIGVVAQQYLSSEQWNKVAEKHSINLSGRAYLFQKKILALLKQNFENDELAVISALIIGYKDLLARELIASYAATGIVHVLAVSGLHVGIIYLVFSFLFSFITRINYGKYIKAVLLLILLWLYALLTGLSPSVLRATTMFSFIIIGTALKRHTNVYNTLAASALVLLIYDPFLLFQLGFQLSYLAVGGIVYLQPRLEQLIITPYWILNKIWALASVALAAQIATFPLVLYYFHQFPVYFLLTNILVIPLVTLIVNLSVLMLLFSFIPFVFKVLVGLISFLLSIQNALVAWFQNLPFALITGISISKFEVLVIYLTLVIFLYAIAYKKARSMYFFIALALLFISLQIQERLKLKQQRVLVVYKISNSTAIDFFDGDLNYFIASDQLERNAQEIGFFIQNFRWERGIEKTEVIDTTFEGDNLYRNKNYIQFFDKKILLWNAAFVAPKTQLEFDCIIFSGKVELDLNKISAKQAIIDASVPKYKWQKIEKECLKYAIPCYNVNTEGAFTFFCQ